MLKTFLRQSFYQPLRFVPLTLKREIIYIRAYRRRPNLSTPLLFSEKINWRIINDRRDRIAFTCDKGEMKKYVASIGADVRIPTTLWQGKNLVELQDAELPDNWILKPNHSSGKVIIGKTSSPNIGMLKRKTRNWLNNFNYSVLGEWAYSNASREFLVEELIGDGREDLPDYKFYVFDGVVRLIHVDTSRFGSPRRRMYSPDWEPLPYRNSVPLDDVQAPPPELEAMKAVASHIGEGYDFIRVDLYRHNGEIWFGEMTPYPAGGAKPYRPEELDQILGDYWRIPELPNL